MTYNHRTDHSYTPDLDFWRSMENLFNAFPYRRERTGYISSNEFITKINNSISPKVRVYK